MPAPENTNPANPSARPAARIAVMLPKLARYGGAESFAWRLAESLSQAGHEVHYLCARAETLAPEGVWVTELGRCGPFKWSKVLWFALAAERARKRGDFDLAIGLGKSLHQDVLRIGGGPQPVFWRLSRRAWPRGPARALKMLRRRLSPANWVSWRIETVQARTTPHIIANSQRSRDWMAEAHPGLDPERLRIIYNPPDLSKYAPLSEEQRAELRRQAGVEEGRTVLTFAGTNFRLKGLGTLIRAMARLPERFLLLVAGGRGPGRWARLARKLGVEERVRFLGRVDDMRAFYNTGDIFVLPTFYDASSNALMEALACGVRCVSSADNGSAAFLPEENILPDAADDAGLAMLLTDVEARPAPGPFAWPEDLPAGMSAWVALVDELLSGREQQ